MNEYGAFEKKWTKAIHQMGYTMVPNAVMIYYKELELTPPEFLLITNIESYRFQATIAPFPAVPTLADRMNMTDRSVQRYLRSLNVKKGLLSIDRRPYRSNQYSFDPLIGRLELLIPKSVTNLSRRGDKLFL